MTRNFRVRSDVVERGSVTKSQKERKLALRGKFESVFSGRHMDSVPKETHVVPVMTSKTLETEDKVRGEKDDRHLLHPTRRQNRLTARDKHPHRDQAVNRKTRWIRVKIPCRLRFCQNPSCKSEKGCVHGDKCHVRHVEAEGKPSEKSKKGGAKGSVAMLKESTQLSCVSQDSFPRKSSLRERGNWDQNTRERKRPSRGIIKKCEPQESSPCAPKFGERSHEETLHQERCARRVALDSAKIFTSSRIWTTLCFRFLVKLRQCRRPLQRDLRSENS